MKWNFRSNIIFITLFEIFLDVIILKASGKYSQELLFNENRGVVLIRVLPGRSSVYRLQCLKNKRKQA